MVATRMSRFVHRADFLIRITRLTRLNHGRGCTIPRTLTSPTIEPAISKIDDRKEPIVKTFCNLANGSYRKRGKRPSTTALVLNGLFGGAKRCGLRVAKSKRSRNRPDYPRQTPSALALIFMLAYRATYDV